MKFKYEGKNRKAEMMAGFVAKNLSAFWKSLLFSATRTANLSRLLSRVEHLLNV